MEDVMEPFSAIFYTGKPQSIIGNYKGSPNSNRKHKPVSRAIYKQTNKQINE